MTSVIHFLVTAFSLVSGMGDGSFLADQDFANPANWSLQQDFGGIQPVSSGIYPAESMVVLRGSNLIGTVEDVQSSDDQRVIITQGLILNSCSPIEARINLQFETTLGTDRPTSLSFNVESQISSTGISQWAAVRDWTNGELILFDYAGCSTGTREASWQQDSVVTIDLTDLISRVVEPGTGRVQAWVAFHPNRFLFGWQTSSSFVASLDQVYWQASE